MKGRLLYILLVGVLGACSNDVESLENAEQTVGLASSRTRVAGDCQIGDDAVGLTFSKTDSGYVTSMQCFGNLYSVP